MRILLLAHFLFVSLFVQGQSKIQPVGTSALTGISLPDGSRLDKRGISTMSAKMLLEMVGDKYGVKLGSPEVLYLPLTAGPAGTAIAKVTEEGWKIDSVPGDKDYWLLQKDGKYLIAYCNQGNKQIDLYLAEASGKPELEVANNTLPPSNGNETDKPPLQQPDSQQSSGQTTEQAQRTGWYQYTTTNFDDGWTAAEEPDWVKVTKGAMMVLLHYEHYRIDESSLDSDVIARNAWNAIIASRYNSMDNFFLYFNSMAWQRPYFVSANLTDASGTHYVVLFRLGRTAWIEFIAPDKNTFMEYFGVDQDKLNTYTYNDYFTKMQNMYSKNYFAVAASDLPGHWTNNYSGMTQYVNTYTGLSAGATAHSSFQEYNIAPDLSYAWSLSMASGWVGAQRFDSAKSKGTVTMKDHWTAHFSDLEGKPKDHPVYFTAFKDGRMLWINGTGYIKN